MAPSSWIEMKLLELIEALEARGYLALVRRDLSRTGSVYVKLCLPPPSETCTAQFTPYILRVSDHPPGKDRSPRLIGSVHPGSDDVHAVWRKAYAQIRKDLKARAKERRR